MRTFHYGRQLTYKSHSADTQVLTEGYFLVEDGDPAENHSRKVRNQEGTC